MPPGTKPFSDPVSDALRWKAPKSSVATLPLSTLTVTGAPRLDEAVAALDRDADLLEHVERLELALLLGLDHAVAAAGRLERDLDAHDHALEGLAALDALELVLVDALVDGGELAVLGELHGAA